MRKMEREKTVEFQFFFSKNNIFSTIFVIKLVLINFMNSSKEELVLMFSTSVASPLRTSLTLS